MTASVRKPFCDVDPSSTGVVLNYRRHRRVHHSRYKSLPFLKVPKHREIVISSFPYLFHILTRYNALRAITHKTRRNFELISRIVTSRSAKREKPVEFLAQELMGEYLCGWVGQVESFVIFL